MRRPCCEKEGTNKGAWSKQEDQKLIDYIRVHGEGCWRSIPKAAGLHRCGKSCRLRWINYLRPDIKRGNFAEDEEELIIKLHALLGNRWSLIAGRLPGRTDNEVKNYWNSHIRRKLLKMGIDPNNHKLHRGLIPLPPPSASAAAAGDDEEPSSGCSIINEEQQQPAVTVLPPLIKPSGTVDNDRISDTRNQSCPLEESVTPMVNASSSSSSSQLNLDLTIAFPSSSSPLEDKANKPASSEVTNNTRNMEDESSPTLLLFQ